ELSGEIALLPGVGEVAQGPAAERHIPVLRGVGVVPERVEHRPDHREQPGDRDHGEEHVQGEPPRRQPPARPTRRTRPRGRTRRGRGQGGHGRSSRITVARKTPMNTSEITSMMVARAEPNPIRLASPTTFWVTRAEISSSPLKPLLMTQTRSKARS